MREDLHRRAPQNDIKREPIILRKREVHTDS
jgi:hypothetical protein